MNSTESIENELKEVNPGLCGISKVNIFSVPIGYFEDNLQELVFKMQHAAAASNITPKEELQSIAPGLLLPGEKQLLNVPEGYFDNLAEKIVIRMNPQNSSVIRMRKRKTMWQYARAAVVTGIIAVSGMMVYNNQHPYAVYDSETLSSEQQVNEGILKLSNDEIVKYLDTSSSSIDNESISNNIEEKQLPNVEELSNLSSTTSD